MSIMCDYSRLADPLRMLGASQEATRHYENGKFVSKKRDPAWRQTISDAHSMDYMLYNASIHKIRAAAASFPDQKMYVSTLCVLRSGHG